MLYLSCLATRYNLQAKDLQERSADELKLSGFEAEQYSNTQSLLHFAYPKE